jgi:hypothetical protein
MPIVPQSASISYSPFLAHLARRRLGEPFDAKPDHAGPPFAPEHFDHFLFFVRNLCIAQMPARIIRQSKQIIRTYIQIFGNHFEKIACWIANSFLVFADQRFAKPAASSQFTLRQV